MKAQSQAAATSGVVRVPHMAVGADVSSSAAASEAITDTRSVAGAFLEQRCIAGFAACWRLAGVCAGLRRQERVGSCDCFLLP